MFIRTPAGDELPFSSVADATMEVSLPRIRRIDRKRAINITADADKENLNLDTVREELADYLDSDFRQRYPGISWSMEGEAREQARDRKFPTHLDVPGALRHLRHAGHPIPFLHPAAHRP